MVTDFLAGTDKILLQDYALYGFTAVQAALRQAGADTVLSLGGGEALVLRNTQATALSARDFLLPSDPTHAGMRVTFAEEFNGLSASASGSGTIWKTTLKIGDQLRTLAPNKEAEYYSDASVGVDPFRDLGRGARHHRRPRQQSAAPGLQLRRIDHRAVLRPAIRLLRGAGRPAVRPGLLARLLAAADGWQLATRDRHLRSPG